MPDEIGESYGWLRLEFEDRRDGHVPVAGGLARGGVLPLEFAAHGAPLT